MNLTCAVLAVSNDSSRRCGVTLLITVVSDDDLFQLDRAHGHSFVGDGERVPKRVERLVHRHF